MRTPSIAVLVLVLTHAAHAQDQPAPEPTQPIELLRKNGHLWPQKFGRDNEGRLLVHFFADSGDPQQAAFRPLLGEQLENGFQSGGAVGWLSMFVHGDGDLLGMTAAEWHLAAVGVATSTPELRQYLAREVPQGTGGRQDAEVFDRMLAIDLLRRRGAIANAPEVRLLAENQLTPAPLRQRARAALMGKPVLDDARQRIAPDKLLLPAAFDFAIEIEHARLPDLSWLTGLGRRLGMKVTADAIAMAGGTISDAQLNGAQSMADVVAELPFGLALRTGNLRLDHSCHIVTFGPPARPSAPPFTMSIATAGQFDGERLQAFVAQAPVEGTAFAKFETVSPTFVQAGTGRPRAELAARVLDSRNAALHVHLPANSKAWPALKVLAAPTAIDSDVHVTFGDPCTIELSIRARHEDDALAWQEALKKALELRPVVEDGMPQYVRAPMKPVIDAVFAPVLATNGDVCTATITIKNFGRAQIEQVMLALIGGGLR